MKHEEVLKLLRQDPEYVAAEEELAPILTIAEEVLCLRLEKGWSQTELARRAGTKQANISKLENGLGNPTLDFLRKVAQALGTDFTVHIGSTQPSEPVPTTVIEVKIGTVQPEALWRNQSTQRSTASQWPATFLPDVYASQTVDFGEAA